jgi:hypothetical protein
VIVSRSALFKAGVIALSFVVGVGVVALGVAIYNMMPHPQKQWNAKAITAAFVSADFRNTPEPAVYLTYALSNNTSRDFSTKLFNDRQNNMPGYLRVAAKRGPIYSSASVSLKNDGFSRWLVFGGTDLLTQSPANEGSPGQFARGESLFIPAKQKVQIILRWRFPENELSTHSSVSIVNTSLFGFVLFDDATRYEIDFPRPLEVSGEFTDADAENIGNKTVPIAPDHKNKPWERYAACQEADRLGPLCEKAGIKTKEPDGWFEVPLPEMALPPKGSLLEADRRSCDVAYQWRAYCLSPAPKQ